MRDRDCGGWGRGERGGGPFGQGRGFWGGGWGGRGGHGGGHGLGERMERGILRFVVLDVLYDAPKHGYEIIKEIEERTQGRYAPSPGTIYPALQYLSDLELISTTESEGDRKVYAITEAGRKERDERAEHLQAFWQRFTAPQAPEGTRVELEFLGEEMGDLMRTVWGRLRPGVGNADQETIRRIRQAVERCKNEVRSILAGAPTEEPAG